MDTTTLFLIIVVVIIITTVLILHSNESFMATKVNNTPAIPCEVSFIDYCRNGWQKGTTNRHQYGVGGVRWRTYPNACASKFLINIKDAQNGVTKTVEYDSSNTRTTLSKNGLETIYSYAIQGRNNLKDLGGASIFRGDNIAEWTITPLPSDKSTPVSSILYKMDTNSSKNCEDNYYYCPLGQCKK